MEFSISAAIILISKDKKALILQRNANDSFPNKWTVPGGKINHKDGDFSKQNICYYPAEYAAVREVEEETCIKVKLEELEFLCSLYLKAINRFIVSFYVVLDRNSDKIGISLSDNQAYKWISRSKIKDYDFIPDIGGEIEAVYIKISR